MVDGVAWLEEVAPEVRSDCFEAVTSANAVLRGVVDARQVQEAGVVDDHDSEDVLLEVDLWLNASS